MTWATVTAWLLTYLVHSTLLIGVIQAYIFAILASVFIASATQAQEDRTTPEGS